MWSRIWSICENQNSTDCAEIAVYRGGFVARDDGLLLHCGCQWLRANTSLSLTIGNTVYFYIVKLSSVRYIRGSGALKKDEGRITKQMNYIA